MRAGRLRHLITVQERVEVLDSNTGEVSSVWIDAATVWGAVEPMTGKEYLQAGSLQSEKTVAIRVRGMTVTEKHRVTANGKQYDIRAVLDRNDQNRELTLMCTQRD